MEADNRLKKIDEALDSNSRNINEQQQLLAKLSENIQSMTGNFSVVSEKASSLHELDQHLIDIKKAKEDALAELNDLRKFKSHVKRKISEELMEDFKKHIRSEADKLTSHVSNFNSLKTEIAKISASLAGLQSEISKFTKISSSIKEKDFSLSKYAIGLKKHSDEKLELLQRIRTLEKLVARERRRR